MWIFRGLRDGVVTTRWPRRPDTYFDAWRGPATVIGDATGAAETPCPTSAIRRGPGGVTLDQGRCIQCGRCVEAAPETFTWSRGSDVATLTREALTVPAETDENLAKVREDLARRTRALGRSVHIRHVDAGSDGAEEWEILALLNPVYDVHRLGVFFTASPRHADILLVTGAGARGMTAPLRRTFEGTPDPKVVIAAGTDAISGGIVGPSYATSSGIGETVPVDVWVPGSPPSPFALLHAILLAIGGVS
ncbi:NADH-quinone oxidoreductase subunit B family protein [Actinoallomurus acaciae]|uniref:Ferredoxin n=1 Tax=Actinoallomurus acaciae TaxID=502577 RepID=A0ABV5YG38_9ACTN